MTAKTELTGFGKQLFDCFKYSDPKKQIEALSKLENEILDYSKCGVFNCNEGENHD
jgi:hypothetical protein